MKISDFIRRKYVVENAHVIALTTGGFVFHEQY
jgi:hypothetical protein